MSGGASAVRARVAGIHRVGSAGTVLDLAVPGSFPPPRAGQFVQIACQPEGVFRLRRPFSISRWCETPAGGELRILFSVVGQGSRWLGERQPGETVDLLGPLGRYFRPLPGRVPVLVGGGRGVAPLLLLADQIAESYPDGLLLYGVGEAAAILPTEGCPYPLHRATLDGSVGHRGTVIDLLRVMLRHGGVSVASAALYGCGPPSMLQALSELAVEEGLPVQVSLETTFGCGTGLCAGCAVPMRPREDEDGDPFHRYRFACTDGPVFDGTQVDWMEVRE